MPIKVSSVCTICTETVSEMAAFVQISMNKRAHAHCFKQQIIDEETAKCDARVDTVIKEMKTEYEARLKQQIIASPLQATSQSPIAPPPVLQTIATDAKESLQALIDRSQERALAPVDYEAAAAGEHHPIKLAKAPAGHSKPRNVTFKNGQWVDAPPGVGVLLTCSCGLATCAMIEKLGMPRPVYQRILAPIEKQEDRDRQAKALREET